MRASHVLSSAHDSRWFAMDELTAPLGQTRGPRRRFPIAWAFAAGLAVSLVGVGLWAVLAKHPSRNKPMASPAPQQLYSEVPLAQPRPESDRTGTIRAPGDSGSHHQQAQTQRDGIDGDFHGQSTAPARCAEFLSSSCARRRSGSRRKCASPGRSFPDIRLFAESGRSFSNRASPDNRAGSCP